MLCQRDREFLYSRKVQTNEELFNSMQSFLSIEEEFSRGWPLPEVAEDTKSKCRTAGNNVDSNERTNSDTGILTLLSLGEGSTSIPPAA